MNPRRPRRPCSWASFGVLLLALSGFAAGCGESSGGGGHGPAEKFAGRWLLDPDSGPFNLTDCTDGSPDVTGAIWPEFQMDYGELTDLTDSSGVCVSFLVSGERAALLPGLGYDVSGDRAVLPATDPFTDEAPVCTVDLGLTMDGLPVIMDVKPDPESWEFKLEPAARGEPQRAVLGVKEGGAAATEIIILDANGGYLPQATCSLTGGTTFFRVNRE